MANIRVNLHVESLLLLGADLNHPRACLWGEKLVGTRNSEGDRCWVSHVLARKDLGE